MSDGKMHYRLICVLCLFLLHGYTYSQNKSDSQELIHFGDIIDVDVIGSTEYDWRGTLNAEGFLNGIDFINDPIYGLCQDKDDVAKAIVKAYSILLKEPQVVVNIIDRSGRPISFLNGAVKRNQRFLIKRAVSLNELIIISGGLTDKASGDIQIIRPKNLSCKEVIRTDNIQNIESSENLINIKKNGGAEVLNLKISDLLRGEKSANPLILNGDIVNVLESEPIYVIGGVINPKQINARSQLNVSRAIASAGGFSKDADVKNVTVFRRDNAETTIIEVDFEKVKANQAEDIVLQKYDIVDVGQMGREKRKIAPAIRVDESARVSSNDTPLKIIE